MPFHSFLCFALLVPVFLAGQILARCLSRALLPAAALLLAAAGAQAQNNAAFVAKSHPATMTTGQLATVTVTMRNSGSTTWAAGTAYRLGSQSPQDNATWGLGRVELPDAVAPGEQTTFTFNVTAPSTAGTYAFQWRMLREYYEWFGAYTAYATITVSDPPPLNAAAFLSQTVSSNMATGQVSAVSVTMKNTGNTTWTSASGYGLGSQNLENNMTWGLNRVAPGVAVAPGQQYTFNFNVTAPTTAGVYNFQWRMLKEYVEWFGTAATNVPVTVGAAATTTVLNAPVSGASATVGTAVALRATPSGNVAAVASVKFFANGVQVGNGTQANGVWTSAWTPAAPGAYSVHASSYNASGVLLSDSAPAAVTVASAGAPPLVGVQIAPPHLNNAPGGTLPGALEVSHDGAATYSIGLPLPPGTAGMQPAISLDYLSKAGNGVAGMGWKVSGFSTIQRCGKTIAHDGRAGRINFDLADRLCLDGVRLLRADGANPGASVAAADAAYWAANAQYRLDREDFSRITRIGSGGFKVEKKNGQVFYYGADANSAIAALGRTDGQVLVWALGRVEDRLGNYYTLSYQQDGTTGEFLPTQFRYGGNSVAQQWPDIAVRFVYQARGDAQVTYIGGARNDLRSRLTNVQTFLATDANGAGGTLVRDHKIQYKESAASGASLVDSMQACATHPTSGASECLPKTSFEWGQASAPAMTALPIPPFTLSPLMMYQGDLDGSGKTSFLSFEYVDGGFTDVKIRLPNGANIVRRLNVSASGMSLPKVGDLNGDGRDDLVLEFYPTKSFYCLTAPATDGTVDFACNAMPVYDSLASMVDIRNDKKMHLVSFKGADVTDCYLNGSTMQCDKIAITGVVPPVIPLLVDGTDLTNRPDPREMALPMPLPLSKQGMSDFYRLYGSVESSQLYANANVCLNQAAGLDCRNVARILAGGQSGNNMSRIASAGDINGDGLTDLAYSTFTYGPARQYYADQGGRTGFDKQRTYAVCFSTENGVDCKNDAGLAPYSYVAFDHTAETDFLQIGDFTGDGVNRVLMAYKPAPPGLTNAVSLLCRYTLAGSRCQEFAYSKAFQAMTKIAMMDDSGVPAFVYKPDFNVNSYSVMSLAGAAAQDKLTAVVNGLQLREEVDYARGDDAAVYKRFVTDPVERRPVYPQYATAPGVMAKELRRSNGAGGWLRTTYRYEGAMADAHGRGELGFGRVQSTDLQTNVVTTVDFSQQFPHVGMILSSKSSAPGAGAPVVLGQTTNRLGSMNLVHASGATTRFPFIAGSTSIRRDLNGKDLGTTTIGGPDALADVQYDSWGNVTGNKVTVSGDAKVFVSQTVSTFNNGTAAWLSVPTSVTNTKTSGGKTVTRKMAFGYNYTNGLRNSVTIQPGEPEYELVTTFGRTGNVFGLINTVVESWFDPATSAAASRTVSDTTYDSKGRFAVSSKNALGQVQAERFDPATGAIIYRLDPNRLATSWVVDGFGRVQVAKEANGNETRQFVKACQGDCPPGATVANITEEFNGTQRITVPRVSYGSASGQQVRTLTWGMDGRQIVRDQRNDAFGRLYETDHPRFAGDAAVVASRQHYDPLGRLQSALTFDDAGTARAVTTAYDGYDITVTNAKQQVRVEKRNAIGQLIQVTDPIGGITGFEYEPFGNLSKTTDPAGNQVVIDYGVTGSKKKLSDPDLGINEYFVNPLGQVWKQVTPEQRKLGQSTTFKYDAVGRLTARIETDLESRWIYDTAAMGIGKLAEVYTGKPELAQRDYRRVHTYDSFGNPQLTTLNLTDATYTVRTDYDGWGRDLKQTYQRSGGAAKAYDSRYGSTGYLERIERAGLALWKVTEQDASQRNTTALLGNGLTQKTVFNAYSGRLTTSKLLTGAGAERLLDTYDYDVLGNVAKRSQYWDQGGFQEDFTYDKLNRLETSWVLSKEKQTFVYDAGAIGAGNLTSKTGVGLYTYPAQGAGAIRPHAVKSIAGSPDFVYDDNGNLKSGAGRLLNWTSFNMPSRMEKAGLSATFVYGPEHARVRQDRSDGSSLIYAGAQETEIKNGQVTVKTYWPGSIGVEIDRPGIAASELSWKHTDRLGSLIGLTDENGLLREKLAYDAWGKRRTLDGGSTPDELDGQVDHRGFTGHEMLDKLDLVHMNGRIYDPRTGRFLSADPMVADWQSGQSFNRYSYVENNPTNFSDPTGFYQVIEPQIYVNGVRLVPDHVVDRANENVKGVVYLQLGTNSAVGARKQAQSAPLNRWPNKGAKPWDYGSFLNPEGGLIDTANKMFDSIEALVDFGNGFGELGHGLMSFDKRKIEAGRDQMKANSADTLVAVVNVIAMRTGNKSAPMVRGGMQTSSQRYFFTNCRCFVAGTLVHTKGGLKKIETIKVGDLVAARDETTGDTSFQAVVRLVRNAGKAVVQVSYADAAGRRGTLGVTPEHPFMTEGSTWTMAGKLAPGDKVMTLDGRPVTVKQVVNDSKPRNTYNFEVESLNTYFVGEQGAWVHNVDCASRSAAFALAKRDARIPRKQHPDSVDNKVRMKDKDGNDILDANKQPILTREYTYTRADGSQVIIQEHSAGHYYGQGGVGDQGPHFNVRPIENPRTGKVPGTSGHYNY